MLSTKVVGQASQASHYFLGHDNYYQENGNLAKERSGWWGEGARRLGLSGEINNKVFTDLLKGKLSDKEQLGIKVDGVLKHRPGFDLTFSVPKSVSIVALLGEDERILTAINHAVDKTLDLIQHTSSQARTFREGETHYENTRNLVVAKFLHDLSRELDPQLHVHAVVMNMTQRQDGKWRSLASQIGNYSEDEKREIKGFIENVRHNRQYLGAIFDAELAYELKALGYQPVRTGKYNNFELAGISSETIETYSTRSKQIDEYMAANGLNGAKAAAYATLTTRKVKEDVRREALKNLWKEKSEINGINAFSEAKSCVQNAINQRNHQPSLEDIQNTHAAIEMVQYAMDHLSYTEVALSEIKIIKTAMSHYLSDSINIKSVIHAMELLQKDGELIPLQGDRGPRLFTTKSLVEAEQEILKGITQKQKNANLLMDANKINAYLRSHDELTLEQKDAIRQIFNTDSQISVLNGRSGSGKTTLLKPMMELAKLNGYRTILLTPSKDASLDLSAQLKQTPKNLWDWIKSLTNREEYATVSRYLAENRSSSKPLGLFQKATAIFVDKAALLSTKQTRDLIQIAERINGRVVFVDDRHGASGFQAGSPFSLMVDNKVNLATLKTNIREQSAEIKAAISDTLQQNITQTFSKIEHRILSFTDKPERLTMMATHYAELKESDRGKCLLLMPSRAQCEELNPLIRDVLKRKGVISHQGTNVEVLLPKSMSDAEYRLAKNYSEGEWIRFNSNIASMQIKRSDYLRIAAVDGKRNVLVLENARKQKIAWMPDKLAFGKFEVFTEKEREIALGDTLTWKRNNAEHQLHNGETLKVIAIENENLVLQKNHKTSVKISLDNMANRHFEYGYSATPYQKMHKTADTVIAYQNSYSRQSHQRLFYKMVGQASQHAWIYTDDKNQLLTKLQEQTGDKITAIESVLNAFNLNQYGSTSSTVDQHVSLIEQALINAFAKIEEKHINAKSKPEGVAREAVSYALSHLAERETAFEHKEVMEIALKYALGNISPKHVTQAVMQAEKEGYLIRGLYSETGTKWTTLEALEMEKEIIHLALKDQGKLNSISTKEITEAHLAATQPKAEHATVIRTMAESMDRYLLVQGYAGTGKTTLLINAKPLFEKQGYELRCLAPTHQAVKELKVRGMNAQTVDSFLVQKKEVQSESKLIFAIDESSMLSNRKMRDILLKLEGIGARGFFIGDTKQYGAIEAGKPKGLLQNVGVKTVYLTDIERQKDPVLLKAVKEIYQENFKQSFETLKDTFIQHEKRDDRLKAISDAYLSLDKVERFKTKINTWSNSDRVNINKLVREGLIKEGSLTGDQLKTTIFIPKDMTQIEKTRAFNYKRNDMIRFSTADSSLRIEKGEYLRVKEVNRDANLLSLAKADGGIIHWSPGSQKINNRVEVYEQDKREIMLGDLINWTRTDKERGYLGASLLQVEAIDKDKVVLQEIKNDKASPTGYQRIGEPITIDPNKPTEKHWDYAYAVTGYKLQGASIEKVLIHAESNRKFLANQKSFLVSVTRGEYKVTIYTDNKDSLLKQIIETPGDKKSALEITGQLKDYQKQNSAVHQSTDLDKQNDLRADELAKSDMISKIEIVKDKNKKSETIEEKLRDTKESITPGSNPKPKLDREKIYQLLVENAESVVERLLGPPKEKHGDKFKFGRNQGSLVVTMQGEKRGLWHDFATGEGGNLFHLVAKSYGLNANDKTSFPSILKESLTVLGVSEESVSHLPLKGTKMQKGVLPAKEMLTKKELKSIAYACVLAKDSQPIEGTLAEKYLREHRAITSEKLPSCLRFHPAVHSSINGCAKPALLAIAKDENHKIKGVQAIFLDEETANKADVKVKKQTWGVTKTGVLPVINAVKQDSIFYIVEGPETALSIHNAFPESQVAISLGKSNFANAKIPQNSHNVVLCLDNDVTATDSEAAIHKAVKKYLEAGKNVWIAKPEKVKDYNDLLKVGGREAVKNNLLNTISYQEYIHKEVKNNHIDFTKISKEVTDHIQKMLQQSNEKMLNSFKDLLEENKEKAIHKLSQANIKIDDYIKNHSDKLINIDSKQVQNNVEKYLSSERKKTTEKRVQHEVNHSQNRPEKSRQIEREKELEL